jgi:hypothetical protein
MARTFGISLGEFLEKIVLRALCGKEPLEAEERRLITELCRFHGVDLKRMARERRLGGCPGAETAKPDEP